jgi:hypothetical protein
MMIIREKIKSKLESLFLFFLTKIKICKIFNIEMYFTFEYISSTRRLMTVVLRIILLCDIEWWLHISSLNHPSTHSHSVTPLLKPHLIP